MTEEGNNSTVRSDNDKQFTASEDEPNPDEWELVGEEHVLLDLVGLVNYDTLKSCDASRLKLIGLLEDEQPVLQLDRFVFVGKREHPPGTCVVFKCNQGKKDDITQTPTTVDNKRTSNSEFELTCCTRKKLVMNQAFLSTRVQNNEDSSNSAD